MNASRVPRAGGEYAAGFMVYAGLRSPISRYARVAQRDINRPLSALDSLSAGEFVSPRDSSMAAAGADGLAALQGLGAAAAAVGAGLDGPHSDDEEVQSAASEALDASGNTMPPAPGLAAAAAAAAAFAAAAAPAAATKPTYGVSAELAAIAAAADPIIGPVIVQALAVSRQQRAMSRSYVKHLEAPDVAAKTMEAIGPTLGNADRTEFRRLASLLFAELSGVDATLDPKSIGSYDAISLAVALRELMEMCSAPYSPGTAAATAPLAAGPTAMVPHDPTAVAAAMGTAMANALGASLATVVSGLPPPSKPAEKKGEKLTSGQMFAFLDTFNGRLGAETKVSPHQVANRTVAAHVRESVVTYGLWPQDSAAGVEKMSPFGTLSGAFNGSDVSALELNLSNGKFEDISRDPKASAVASTKEYLTRLRLLVTTIAVFLCGVKCDKAPHLIAGHETEDFCSVLQCNEFLTFADTLSERPLATVKRVVEQTLTDIATAANVRTGERVSFTRALKDGLVQLKWRAEMVSYTGPGGGSSGEGADVTPPAAEKTASRLTEENIAEMIKSAISMAGLGGGRGKGAGRGRGKSAEEKKTAYEQRKRAREVEHEYQVGGVSTKRQAKKGGYDDAPKCSRSGCQKESWCWYSHAHL